MRPTIPRYHFVLFVVTFLAALPVLAQGRCELSDTMTQCFDRYRMLPDEYVKQEEVALQEQPTGVDTSGANLTTGTKDFSPLMALAALLGQGTSGGSGTLVFDHNFHLPTFDKLNDSNNAQLKAVLNTQPTISGALRAKLHEKTLDDQIPRIEQKIGELDDFTVQLTYNFTNNSTGRGFEQYKKNYKNLCNVAYADWKKQADKWIDATRETLGESFKQAPPDSEVSFDKMVPAMAAQALVLTEAQARQLASTNPQVKRDAALASYYMLLDNQPQFHLTAERKFRDPLVGPDELMVDVTYEWSRVNLNAATKKCDGNWGTEECLDAYTAYVNGEEKGKGEEEMRKEMEQGDRLSFTGEYVDIGGDSIDAGLSELGTLVLEPVHKLTLKLDWSRKLSFGEGDPVKMDLAASYEDVSDDPHRQDRGVASLTLTCRVGNMEIPFGIVYANHGEFLGDVDARLSAHIGLNFKMPDGNGAQ
jgi:hypothetical protein